MCCAFLSLVLLGPRFFGALWWLFQPLRWQTAFNSWPGGSLWFIWPILGIIFLPWTTLMYLILGGTPFVGFDWVWLGLALLADIASYSGSAYGNRLRIPGMS